MGRLLVRRLQRRDDAQTAQEAHGYVHGEIRRRSAEMLATFNDDRTATGRKFAMTTVSDHAGSRTRTHRHH